MLLRHPHEAANYLSVCAQAEHYIDFCARIKANIKAQLTAYIACQQKTISVANKAA